jgi:hypothetical protein
VGEQVHGDHGCGWQQQRDQQVEPGPGGLPVLGAVPDQPGSPDRGAEAGERPVESCDGQQPGQDQDGRCHARLLVPVMGRSTSANAGRQLGASTQLSW